MAAAPGGGILHASLRCVNAPQPVRLLEPGTPETFIEVFAGVWERRVGKMRVEKRFVVSSGGDAAVGWGWGGGLNKGAADPKGAPVAPAVTVVNRPGI